VAPLLGRATLSTKTTTTSPAIDESGDHCQLGGTPDDKTHKLSLKKASVHTDDAEAQRTRQPG